VTAPGSLPSAHAVLSPSSAERWIGCPASVRVVNAMPKDSGFNDSIYAAEGTKAHALGELEASLTFGMITPRQYTIRYNKWLKTEPLLDEEDLLEMKGHVAAYVALIVERQALYPNSQVMLEQRMPTGVPSSWGTSDTVIVSPQHVEIIDLKYGVGVAVSAYGNPQLKLYAVGALDLFGDVLGDTEVVRWTVFQPRIQSQSTEEATPEELRAWRASLLPIAEAALGDDAEFGPSEAACRWCPAAGECRARVEYMTAQDFGKQPDLLSPEELGDLLERVSDIKKWCEDVTVAGLRKAYSEGIDIPGWKVVLSGGQRYITDHVAASKTFENRGFDLQEVMAPAKLKGLGDLEKVIKSHAVGPKKDATLESVLGELVGKTPGKPALAPQDDRRDAISPDREAVKEFS